MSDSIKLSPKYGLNPTIPVCFWCGKEKGEIALMGHIGDGRKHEDIKAPMHMVLDYEPCDECKKNMELGFTIVEATGEPNALTSMPIQDGIYPTGRYVVIKKEAAIKIFGYENTKRGKAFMDVETFTQMFVK